jgi:hypothetical protein
MRTPTAGRVQFLTMMDPEVVADIKQAADEERRPAWDVIGHDLVDILGLHKTQRKVTREPCVCNWEKRTRLNAGGYHPFWRW